MNRRTRLFLYAGLWTILGVTVARPQDEATAPGPQQGQGRRWQGQEGGQRPLIGKITAVQDGALEITGPDGKVVTVKLTGQTEFRKDRQPAKASDFKVGDMVMVRGDENADHTVTARLIGARTGGVMGTGPGSGRGGGMLMGTLGKDYVVGEVKAVDPPKLTVLRTDSVTQVLELNEETTLHKARESITMADIEVGDYVVARGATQNNVFVPKGVMVMSAEQWKRFQEFAALGNVAKPSGPDATPPKPQE